MEYRFRILKEFFQVLVLVSCLGLPLFADTVTIGFEGVATNNFPVPVTPIQPHGEGGFTLSVSFPTNAIYPDSQGLFNTNGSDVFGWSNLFPLVLTFTNDSGSLFDLISLDGSNLFFGTLAGPLDLVGQLAGGGTVTETISFGTIDTWTTFNNFSGFTDLDSLVISTQGVGMGGDPAIDNIVFQTVPEPTTLTLLAAGLTGLGVFRKRFS